MKRLYVLILEVPCLAVMFSPIHYSLCIMKIAVMHETSSIKTYSFHFSSPHILCTHTILFYEE